MTIFVDAIYNYGRQGKWCHMWSDTLDNDELITFATNIGLRPEWLQISRGKIVAEFPHFDLVPSKRNLAIKKGAVEKSLSTWLKEKIDNGKPD